MEFYNRTVAYFMKNPSSCLATGVVIIGGLYTTYYLVVVVKKPRIVCSDKKLQRLLEQHCPVSKEYYWPTFWCFQSHAQTLLRAFIPSHAPFSYRSELLMTPDGGQIKLDWDDARCSPYPLESRPIVLLLPGLTGASKDKYITHLVHETAKMGYRCVVFNYRGNGGSVLLTPRTYCAANTEDLTLVVQYINRTYPNAPIIGVGISLGGSILFNYLAENGKDAGLLAGMCVSVAWNFTESTKSLETPLNKFFFNSYLTKVLTRRVEVYVYFYFF